LKQSYAPPEVSDLALIITGLFSALTAVINLLYFTRYEIPGSFDWGSSGGIQ